MQVKHIKIENKRATYNKADGTIVCGNKGYKIEFEFDSEWDAYEKKKAKFEFYFLGTYKHIIVEFSGNTCKVPPLYNVPFVKVGVFVEDAICTTTKAVIECDEGALCGKSRSMLSPEIISAINETLKGTDGVGIKSVEQTTISTEDNGINVITITLTDGQEFPFIVHNGSRGGQGTDGKDGYTPQREIDYWTEADKAEIKSYVDEAILGGAW